MTGRLLDTDHLVFAKEFFGDLMKLEPPVRQKVMDLPGKFAAGSERAGTNLERIIGSVDSRVRTVRVDLFWRGIVLNFEPHLYILMRVLPEEDANKWAKRHRFSVNPITGIFEVISISEINELVVADAPPPTGSTLYEHRKDKDFIRLGVDPDLLPALRRLVTEEEALGISAFLPPAQAAAVLGLADNREVEALWAEIAEQYDIDTTEEIDTADGVAAFERPGTKADFLLTVTDEEVAAALSGNVEAWQTFLHPSQRKVAYKETFNGPAKVTGGAGTGKTVVVMHRAKFLADRLLIDVDDQGRPDKDSRVLVATFTKALRGSLHHTMREFCTPEQFRRIDIVNVDAHSLQIARTAHPKLGIAYQGILFELADQAVSESGLDLDGYDSQFLLTEWEQVILARGHKTAVDYLISPRPRRGRRLTRDARKKVWAAIDHLTDNLHRQNRATYLQIAQIAADTLDARTIRPYRHVVIDEAQDLHPLHWAFLRANVRGQIAEPNDMFMVGDAHQRIYDHKVSLSALGIETRGRSKRLTINYRTSHQILAWSLALLRGETFDDLDGGIDPAAGYHSSFTGPAPEQRRFTLASQEAIWIADKAQEWLQEGAPMTIGIVTPYKNHLGPIRDALTERGMTHTNVPDDTDRDTQPPAQVVLSTMHSAKGLEFTRMIVAAVNDDAIPSRVTPEATDPVQHAADMLRERCLLYVACTRARDRLVVTSSGTPSRLLPT
jgi:superfamily I DNA/RNA helicase